MSGPANTGKLQTAAVLFIGAAGVTAVGVQASMYGVLERTGRISVIQIGIAASAEMIALAVAVIMAGKMVRYLGSPVVALLAASGLVVANAMMPNSMGLSVIIERFGAGIAGGILLWLANAYIVATQRAARLAALFLVVQTVVQFSVAGGAATFAPDNADAIPLVMAVCGFVALILVVAIGRWKAAPQAEAESSPFRFDKANVLALSVTLLVQFSLVGGWILVELVGNAAHLSAGAISGATPVMLGAQVIGGLAALHYSDRVGWRTALIWGGPLLAAVQLLLGATASALPYLALAFVYGLLWNFMLPQLTAMSLAVDPSLRLARIGPAAVVAGAALAPLAASAFADHLSPAVATIAFAAPSLAICIPAGLLQSCLKHSRVEFAS